MGRRFDALAPNTQAGFSDLQQRDKMLRCIPLHSTPIYSAIASVAYSVAWVDTLRLLSDRIPSLCGLHEVLIRAITVS